MPVELRIRWDGDAPGLGEHRLSLAAFGQPLERLLVALRRIASNRIVQAEDPDRGATGGRLHRAAERLDVEIAAIEDGCVTLRTVCVSNVGPNLPLFDTIAEEAVDELLSSIDAEKSGKPRNGMVRKYLKSLPSGVRSQEYTLSVNGAQRRSVTVGELQLVDAVDEMPGFVRIKGRIVGVGFEPGRPEVRFLAAVGEEQRTIVCTATEQQVERALALRHEDVTALAVTSTARPRLLWLRRPAEVRAPDAPVHHARVFDAWDGLLRRLAQ
jgi:hypothetical protein